MWWQWQLKQKTVTTTPFAQITMEEEWEKKRGRRWCKSKVRGCAWERHRDKTVLSVSDFQEKKKRSKEKTTTKDSTKKEEQNPFVDFLLCFASFVLF